MCDMSHVHRGLEVLHAGLFRRDIGDNADLPMSVEKNLTGGSAGVLSLVAFCHGPVGHSRGHGHGT
jgi:hypothetical protein